MDPQLQAVAFSQGPDLPTEATVHVSKPNPVQLVRDQRELALPSILRAKAPFAVVPAQLLQLVVQASHTRITYLWLVFPTTLGS